MHTERFAILKWESEGEPYLAAIDMGLKAFDEKDKYPYYVWMALPRAEVLDDAESERLNAIEDRLQTALEQDAEVMYVGRITEPERRAMMWYVSSEKGIAPLFEKVKDEMEGVMEHDPEWKLVDAFFQHDQG